MPGKRAGEAIIKCTRVWRTEDRPGSEGTYIARLSNKNRRCLNVGERAYLRISYGKASVLACLSVDPNLDNNTIRLDQTLRQALCLKKVMRRDDELVYRADGKGPEETPSAEISTDPLLALTPLSTGHCRPGAEKKTLSHPIVVQPSGFPGPTLLARLFKYQYLICQVHHAFSRDMEKPLVRLTTQSMEDIGIAPGDKVLLISEHTQESMRCLTLEAREPLPLRSMYHNFTPVCPGEYYTGSMLPWITIDNDARRKLKIEPWQAIVVGRDPYHALTLEFNQVATGLALAALGGAIAVPDQFKPLLPLGIVAIGLVAVGLLIWQKIRSRI